MATHQEPLTEKGAQHLDLFMERTPHTELAEFLEQTGARLGIQRDWAKFLDTYPLLLGATCPQPVPGPTCSPTTPTPRATPG
ncbi:hypothetical protein [Streptomyces noursei]|uniref:hypothetical protein n=1 Tax=Streptomyces noursei TaxID=1971 RepID=UPI001673ECFB|nr:hypothetical protein [Streptomyces noursei]MCZ1020485.1 hypothetical protein [Streptomyces noursei]GGX13441.1 hypothetical protein GCM10010341_38730 [Streptomyces noursei]